MEDWMRAAMTSINFFEAETAGLSMKKVAAEKLHHLADAKQYLELFLQRSLQGDSKPGATSEQISKRIKDIHRHLSTVSLQIDVCRYLARREEAQKGVLIILSGSSVSTNREDANTISTSQLRPGSSTQLSVKPKPTLFSTDPNVKHNLAAMILLNGSSVEEGFGLCLRVVADCQLDGMTVLKRTVEFLAKPEEIGEANIKEIERLSKCVEQSGYNKDLYNMDKVLISVIDLIQRKDSCHPDLMSATVDSLLRLIKDDMNKITAYTTSGRLRSAYMLAVRLGQIDAVRRIRERATELQQPAVYKMCDKWLQNRR
ncbi:hypothetical protein BIW11_06473 [Tropilaelaps mercedesae]|uniref:ZFYVE26-like TPR repeats domain-containing protein n=1 Tax=Tropilaelaps mercedesae TaxID=418985 RepID=A0A1V9XXZ9_9ACAR|nr:hypothetical protein BIW11_06473 [Tropilaelaps mercedesae]